MQPAVTITLSQLKTLKLTTLNTVHRKTKKRKKETNNYRQLSSIPALVFLFAVIITRHNVATAFLCECNVEVLSLIYLIYVT